MKYKRLSELASILGSSHKTLPGLRRTTTRLLEQIRNNPSLSPEIDASVHAITSHREVESYVNDAEALLSSGNAIAAELLLMGVSILSTEREAAVARLAMLYESRSEYSQTVDFMKQLLERKGLDEEVSYQLSFALYMTGRPDEALEYLLPYYIYSPSRRVSRLCGFILKKIGRFEEAIDVLTSTIKSHPDDIYSITALSDIYTEVGLYQLGLDTLRCIPDDLLDTSHKLREALIFRLMGDLERSIRMANQIIRDEAFTPPILWPQCFNYSIAGAKYSQSLLSISQQYWKSEAFFEPCLEQLPPSSGTLGKRPIRLGFMTSDIGEHVVSRFLFPLIRNCDHNRFYIALFSSARRFEARALEILDYPDDVFSLEGLSLNDANLCIREADLDILIDTNGFTKGSGLPIISRRCAPIQCHYIGYHATTGLKAIDYFLGDSITASEDLQSQYTEKLIQIPKAWMAYDPKIEFPSASSTTRRDCLVMGSFSQVAKINQTTLEYWAAALNMAPDSILVIKDKGLNCQATCQRIESTLQSFGVENQRIYLIGPVASHLDHLDCYNAIDIALDTTPWSSATTAFEALGMGVPLVAIWGDTTSGRMSSSVVSAAGMGHLIAHSKEEFAQIVSELAKDYKQLRNNKAAMQKRIRSGILFDEQRISRDFYGTIERLVVNHSPNTQPN